MPSRRLIATAAASVRGSSTAVILRRERAQPHVPLSLSLVGSLNTSRTVSFQQRGKLISDVYDILAWN